MQVQVEIYADKKSSRKVRITYSDLPGFRLEMDFSPLINFFNLSGDFCLLHWQAMPKGRRRWGIWDEASKNYKSFNYKSLIIEAFGELLQMPESGLIKPTAVILYRNCRLFQEERLLKIREN